MSKEYVGALSGSEFQWRGERYDGTSTRTGPLQSPRPWRIPGHRISYGEAPYNGGA